MSQSTLIRVNPTLIINWLQITSVAVVESEADGKFVCVCSSDNHRATIPWAAGGERLLNYLASIAEDLTSPPRVDEPPTEESHARSFADRFVRPST